MVAFSVCDRTLSVRLCVYAQKGTELLPRVEVLERRGGRML